jgi:hypothetical protein
VYEQGHYRCFKYVVLDRVSPYAPLWGCADAHVYALRQRFRERAFGPVGASERPGDTVEQALALIAPLGQFFGLDIWRRNLGVKDGHLIFLDPVCNDKTSEEDFEERIYIPKAA